VSTGQSRREAADPCGSHSPGDGSWWEHDAQGIPLCRVCDRCETHKLSRYRPEILTGYTQADLDEPIEEDL
jgi:hypothetical protein